MLFKKRKKEHVTACSSLTHVLTSPRICQRGVKSRGRCQRAAFLRGHGATCERAHTNDPRHSRQLRTPVFQRSSGVVLQPDHWWVQIIIANALTCRERVKAGAMVLFRWMDEKRTRKGDFSRRKAHVGVHSTSPWLLDCSTCVNYQRWAFMQDMVFYRFSVLL